MRAAWVRSPRAPPGLGVSEEGGGQELGRGGQTGVGVGGEVRVDAGVGHSPTSVTGPSARRMVGGMGCLPEPSVATTT